MPDLKSRITALERLTKGILAELGGLAIQFAHMRGELDETRGRVSTLLNNMAQNTLENQRRISELETKIDTVHSRSPKNPIKFA